MTRQIETEYDIGERVWYTDKNGEVYIGTIYSINYHLNAKGKENVTYAFIADGGLHKFYVRADLLHKEKKISLLTKIFRRWHIEEYQSRNL